jgi:uncharacterized protein (DUF58 family)
MKLTDVMHYSNLSFLAKKAMEGFITGIHKSPLRGYSVEFAEHRSYNQGDNIKNLDWKLLAKTDKKYIKEFIEETNLRCHFWIDMSDSMRFPEKEQLKLKFALLSAASMGYLLHRQRDAFRFTLFNSEKTLWESELKSTQSHLQYCIHHFNTLWDGNKTEHALGSFSFNQLLKGVKKRNLVVILSDFLFEPQERTEDTFWQTVSYLHFLKCDVLLLHITDHEIERNLALGDQPIHFIDLETEQRIKLHPSEYMEAYKKQEKQRVDALKERCLSLGLHYFDCDVHKDVEFALQQFFIQHQGLT